MADHHQKAGLARAAALSDTQRSEIAKAAAKARWSKPREPSDARLKTAQDKVERQMKRLAAAMEDFNKAGAPAVASLVELGKAMQRVRELLLTSEQR